MRDLLITAVVGALGGICGAAAVWYVPRLWRWLMLRDYYEAKDNSHD